MIAKKGNGNIYIGPNQIKEYLDRGFDIYDDNGHKLNDPLKYASKNVKTIQLFSGGNSQ